MGYYNNKGHFFSEEDTLEHRAKYGTANSVTNEKGTDGKKNNSSEYNHDYYMKNKEKWADNKEWSKDDKDFDENNYNEKNLIPGTDLYSFKNKDGQTVILFEDNKWVLPAGAELDGDMKKRLKELFAGNVSRDDVAKVSSVINAGKTSGEKEFDVEAAARDVIRGKYKNGAERKAALGDDYELVQKKVNELMKKSGGSGKKDGSSSKTEGASEKKDSKETRDFSKIAADYYQEKGKKRTEEEKKKKNNSLKQYFGEDGAIISYYDGRY